MKLKRNLFIFLIQFPYTSRRQHRLFRQQKHRTRPKHDTFRDQSKQNKTCIYLFLCNQKCIELGMVLYVFVYAEHDFEVYKGVFLTPKQNTYLGAFNQSHFALRKGHSRHSHVESKLQHQTELEADKTACLTPSQIYSRGDKRRARHLFISPNSKLQTCARINAETKADNFASYSQPSGLLENPYSSCAFRTFTS